MNDAAALTVSVVMKGLILSSMAAASVGMLAEAGCPADLTGDRIVNGDDLGVLLGSWGSSGGKTGADIDANGTVDGDDLGMLLAAWGPCPITVPEWATLVEAVPDPSVVVDAALRESIAATGLAWRVRDTATQVEMLLVPPGTFDMGCISPSTGASCFAQELPVHAVTLTRAVYVGRYELTQSQWMATTGSNPSFFGPNFSSDWANRPVEQVTFAGVLAYLAATGMRLPTEAEWERACRAGTQTPFHNGSAEGSSIGPIAWHGGNSGGFTHPVGTKAGNALGLHDMHGNVYEWVSDWYDLYPATPQVDPTGPATATRRVIRGGSWINNATFLRSSFRNGELPGNKGNGLGFRVARDP